MIEPKLIFKAELIDNQMKVTLGTGHEALLALGLMKTNLFITDLLMQNEIKVEMAQPKILKPESEIMIPDSILTKL